MQFTDFLTTENITLLIVIGGVIFSVWNSVKNPQVSLDKRQAVESEQEKGKTGILAQQVQWEKEATDKKFVDMQAQFATIMTLNQNHLHTVESKLDATISSQNQTNVEIAKLETTIALFLKMFPAMTTNIIQK